MLVIQKRHRWKWWKQNRRVPGGFKGQCSRISFHPCGREPADEAPVLDCYSPRFGIVGPSGLKFGTHSFRIGAVFCGRRRILISGHSYIFWAAHQANRLAIGSQLGLSQWATVECRGCQGLRWPGLLPLLFKDTSALPPEVLVIYLGGNDLGFLKGKALVLQARDDLKFIQHQWPGTGSRELDVRPMGSSKIFKGWVASLLASPPDSA